jgi:hypothetical protein
MADKEHFYKVPDRDKGPDKHGRSMSDEVHNERVHAQLGSRKNKSLSQYINPASFCDTPECQNPATKFTWENGLGCEDHSV